MSTQQPMFVSVAVSNARYGNSFLLKILFTEDLYTVITFCQYFLWIYFVNLNTMADSVGSNTEKKKAEPTNGCGDHCDGHHHSNERFVSHVFTYRQVVVLPGKLNFFYRFLNNFSVWKLWFFLSGAKSKDKKKKGKNAKSNLPKDDGEEMPLPPASLQVPLISF